ncbi:thiol-disulfide oxidoreductase DCC family protein [Ideonella dechloratans]|uniref:thiol-disulfide oxidoreductase DCC family protein n=1 Tax=Ideonella dechloratans TaxID=36863 RepID=UPI0035AD96E1
MNQPLSRPEAAAAALEVFFDGACPLCRREIAHYRRLTPRQPIAWRDLSEPATCAALDDPGVPNRAALLARFHVRDAAGHWHAGAAGFLRLWAALPRWWLLAAAVQALPGAPWLAERAYRRFLRWRPALQARARRLLGERGEADCGAACDPQRGRHG